jgi:quercetin dioxygenase-like cupin family protein
MNDAGSLMNVERWDSELDGPPTEATLSARLEEKGFRVSRYVYPAGTIFPEHNHSIDKIDAVLSGRFRIVIKDLDVILEAGDHIYVPRGTVHRAEVVGDEPVVSLDATRT